MKKFRKLISGFLAAALIFTQTIVPAYSVELAEGVSETSQTPGSDSGSDEAADAPETGEPDDASESGDTGEAVSEETQTKDAAYYEGIQRSIDEKKQAAIEADVYGMGYSFAINEEESAYLDSRIEEDYAAAGQSTEIVVARDELKCIYDTDYYYYKMSPEWRTIYDKLYTVANDALSSTVDFSANTLAKVSFDTTLSEAQLWRLWFRFYYSNPQFFFIDNGFSRSYINGDTNQNVAMYIMVNTRFISYSARKTAKESLDSITSELISSINKKSTPLEKQEAIYTWLCNKITYTPVTNADQDIAAAFVNKKCVCNGYALATAYLSNAVNIKCITVTSDTHAWNMVFLYDNWYEWDVTWMDNDNGENNFDYRWLNKSHATVLATDSQGSHIYEDLWDNDLPSATLDEVATNGIYSIAVTTPPTTLEYVYGSGYDLTGGILTVTKANGDTEEVDMAEALAAGDLTVTGYTATKIGSQTLTLKYGGKTTTLTVNVIVDPTDPPVTMMVDGDGSTKTNYLDLQSALNAITKAGHYRIDIRHTQEYDSVTIPSKANSVTIYTNSNVYLKTDKITANSDLNILGNVAAKSESYKGPALTIASGKIVHVSSYINVGDDYTFRSITGTSSSDFSAYDCKVLVDGDIGSLRILSTSGDDAYIATTGSISSVTYLQGFLLLAGLNKTASITNIGRNSTIGLAATVNNGVYKFAGLTVKNLPTDCTLSVVAMDETCSNRITIPAGTTLFKTTASGTYSKANVTTPNTTSDGKALSLVKNGTEVRAEIDGIAALAVDGEVVGTYTSFELALADVQKDKANVIMLSTSVAPSSFTLPTSAQIGTGSLAIVGGTYRDENGSSIVPLSAAWQDMLEANEDGVITLTLPASVTTLSVPYDFELDNFTVNTSAALTIKPSKKLRLSCDTFGLSADITAAAGSSADISVESCLMIRNITGTSTSTLKINSEDKCGDIKSFKKITANNNGCHLTGTMSDIGEFFGKLELEETTAKATITTMDTGSGVFLRGELSNGALSLAQLTVTNVKGDSGTISINIENVNWESIPLPNGTVVMKAGDKNIDFTSKLVVTNYLSDGKTLGGVFKYGTDIKYELADAVTLTVGDQETRYFPNLEKAFEAVQAGETNTINLNFDLAPSTFALPTAAQIGTGTLVIRGIIDEATEQIATLTLPDSVKSISAPYDLSLEAITINGAEGLTISGSKKLNLNYVFFGSPTDIKANTGTAAQISLRSVYNFRNITGTSTATLYIGASREVNNVTSFKKVTTDINNSANLLLNGTMSDIAEFSGSLWFNKTSAKATITKISGESKVILLGEISDGTLTIAPLTVSGFADDIALKVYIVNETNERLPVASGTKLFTLNCGEDEFYENNLGEKITIVNKTNGTEGDTLSAYLYGSDLKAEFGEAVELRVNGKSQYFPSLELALKALKSDEVNYICLQADIDAETLVFPTDLGTIGRAIIDGGADKHKLTLHNVSVITSKIPVSFRRLELVNLKADGVSSGAPLTINAIECALVLDTVKTDSLLSVSTTDSNELMLNNVEAEFEDVSGTTSSKLYVGGSAIKVKNISNFEIVLGVYPDEFTYIQTGVMNINISEGITVTGSVTDIGKLSASLTLENGAAANITNLSNYREKLINVDCDITLIAVASDSVLKLPALTVNSIEGAKFTVKNSAGEIIPVASGTTLFTLNCGEDEFYKNKIGEKIIIVNKIGGTEGNELSAYLYGTELRAEYGKALKLVIAGEDNQYFPNFDLAFKELKSNEANNVILQADIDAAAFTLPLSTKIFNGSLKITGAGHKLTLHNVITLTPAYDFALESIELIPLNTAGAQVSTFTINGSKDVTLYDVSCDKTKTTISVSTGAGSSLNVKSAGVKFGTFTGTSTSKLHISGNTTVDNVKTFAKVYIDSGDLTVNSSMSGVDALYCDDDNVSLILPPKASATIITLGKDANVANVILLDDEADGLKLPSLTVTNIVGAKMTIKDSTGKNVIPLASGTTLFTLKCGETEFYNKKIGEKINIVNRMGGTTGDELSAYLYGTELKAEYGKAIRLMITDEDDQFFPNFNLAFKAVKKEKTNTIILQTDIDAAKFVLPASAQVGGGSLTINGKGHTLTLHNVTALTPGYELTLKEIELIPLNTAGEYVSTFTITGSKHLFINELKCDKTKTTINVNTGKNSDLEITNTNVKFGTIIGTPTSTLKVHHNVTADKVEKFGTVFIDNGTLTVNSSISGVDKLYGSKMMESQNGWLILPSTATVTITTLGYSNMSGNLILLDDAADGLTLPKVTVTNVTGATITVKDSANMSAIGVPSGTAIFKVTGTEADFNAKIKPNLKITNTTSDNKDLEAFYYNKEIRAESASTLMLTVRDANNNVVSEANYPNFEKAFPAVQKDKRNIITLNEDIDAAKFVLPAAAQIGDGSLEIIGKNGLKNLTLHNISSLSGSYKLTLTNIVLVPMNSKGDAQVTAFSITGAKGVVLTNFKCDNTKTTINVTVGSGSVLELSGCAAKFGTLTGTSTSTLNINGHPTAEKVSKFGLIETGNGEFTVNNSITSVTKLTTPNPEYDEGGLVLAPTAAAAITEAEHANIMLLAETDADGNITKLPKLTLTKVTAGDPSQITVMKNGTRDAVAIPSGTAIFKVTGKEDDFNANMKPNFTIANKTSAGKDLEAFYYKKEIRAEVPSAITLKVEGDAPVNYPNLEKALAGVQKGRINTIELNEDIEATKLALPTDSTIKSLNIVGNNHTLTLTGVTKISPKYGMSLVDIKIICATKTGADAALTLDFSTGDAAISNLTLVKGKSLTVKGGKANKLTLGKCSTIESLTGFSSIEMSDKVTIGKTFTANNVNLGAAANLTINNGATLTVNKGMSITGEAGSKITLVKGFKPIVLNGTIADNIKFVSYENETLEDQPIFKTKLILSGKYDVSGIAPDNGLDYDLLTKNGIVYLKAYTIVLNEDPDQKFAFWDDAIKAMNSSTTNYKLTLLADVNIGGALKVPAKGKFASLTIIGNGNKLTFTGTSASLKGTTTFSNILLNAVKVVKGEETPVAYKFTVPKGSTLTFENVKSTAKVTATGTVIGQVTIVNEA